MAISRIFPTATLALVWFGSGVVVIARSEDVSTFTIMIGIWDFEGRCPWRWKMTTVSVVPGIHKGLRGYIRTS